MRTMLSRALNILRTEPVLVAGAAQAVIALAVSGGLNLPPGQIGALEAATTAALGLAAAASVRPFRVPALTGFTSAVITLLAAFQVPHANPGTVSTLNAVVVAVLMLFRGHVTPKATLAAQAAAHQQYPAGAST